MDQGMDAMKAMILRRIVSLDEVDAPLELVDMPAPVPSTGEVLIEVAACGVCHTELDEIEGRAAPPNFPIVLGHEIVGVFLFTDGVNVANRFIKPPGERNLNLMMDELAESGIPVIACSACARFRGLQKEHASANIRASGLGSLASFIQEADRFVTFGD